LPKPSKTSLDGQKDKESKKGRAQKLKLLTLRAVVLVRPLKAEAGSVMNRLAAKSIITREENIIATR
jgi:hypothetical protein